jgi:hypothetical protein
MSQQDSFNPHQARDLAIHATSLAAPLPGEAL